MQTASSKKLTFKQTLCRHWLLAGLYTLGTLIVLWVTVSRISEIPWRYYRYWQTAGVYLLVLAGYVGFDCLNLLLLRRSDRWQPLFIPSLIGFILIANSGEPSIKKYTDHIECISRMKQITMVCFQYAERTGEYPDSLETLLRLELLDEKTLTCPGNPWHNPGDIDYLYFGKGCKSGNEARRNDILLTDRPENHRGKPKFQGKVSFSLYSTSCEQDFPTEQQNGKAYE